MPRKGAVPKRDVLPDPVYGNKTVTRFINKVMLDGKKGVAEKIVYGAFDICHSKLNKEPIEIFEQALNNVMPVLEVRARRVGGANYQVPVEVRADRRLTLGIRWMVNYARQRSERTMEERLAGELMDAFNNTGAAVKKKEDTHKMTLTARETAEYSNIGINKIDSMLRVPNCPFVLFVGTKKLVKRREFEEYISQKLVI